ncbi:MAG: glycosyltransferase family 4 protein [Candidatus Woesearchaeota archaeon]
MKKPLRVLMFGWEFPPFKTGGLGTACYGLTKGLARNNVQVTFVMPVAPEDAKAEFVKLIGANQFAKNIKTIPVPSMLAPYQTAEQYEEDYAPLSTKGFYGKNIYAEAKRFARIGKTIAKKERHDVIHAHDWMTYEAGIEAKKTSGKPLVVHIHATEFDRTADNPNHYIAHKEYEGLKAADIIIANSNLTKNNVIKHYKIPEHKIRVVHWGIEEDSPEYHTNYKSPLNKKSKVVLFLGRITIQKGPDYFIEVAKKVSEFEPNTLFVIAGDGDMMPRIINRAHEIGIADKTIFTGFLQGPDVHKAFQMADVYVMPSVSEPFGLVALESLKNKTPVIVSKQSGVSEVLKHCLKTDFWDINKMTDMIVSVLRHKELQEELRENGHSESNKFNLNEPAKRVKAIYEEVTR